MRRFFFSLFGIGLFLFASRSDRWEIIGPGGGGSQFYPTVSPHDPRRVLVACDMTGSYLTEDGGASWRMFNLGGTTRFFEWDPNNPRIIYAGANALYRSADGGVSWMLLYPPAREVTAVEMIDDSAFAALVVNGGRPRITGLAVDSDRSNILFAAFGRTLRVSQDAGGTWQLAREFPTNIRRIWAGRGSVYVASERSLDMMEAGEWHEIVNVSSPWTDMVGAPPVFYAIRDGAGAVSDDAGKSWRNLRLPGASGRFVTIATSTRHPDTAYASYDGLQADGQMWFGVAKTSDRGRTWTLVWKESERAGTNIHDAWLTPMFGPGWSGRPLYLGVAPGDPDICYATDMGRTMRTTDGGKTWDAVYSRRMNNGWASTGLDVTTSYGVHFDPFDPHHMFISYTDIGAFGSEDGGRTWVTATEGVPEEWRNTTYWMEFDPEVRGRVWAAASWTHDLPRPKMWRDTAVSTYRGGVVRSEDGGKTWQKSNTGMANAATTDILLDPKSSKGARTLYAAAFGKGIYKSTDDGRSWTLKNQGIVGDEPFAWRISRTSEGALYLVVARRSEDGSIGNSSDGALYYSEDRAEHWARVPLPEGVNGPNGLATDPQDAKRLYLATWRRRIRASDGGGGIYLSEDSGATWLRVLKDDQHIYDVTADPRDPHVLYACGFESSAWRSGDRGETWHRIRGYNFKWGHRVIPDPLNPAFIYIATFGGSVWHGPAVGDPNAMEDGLRK
jgi:photosystem II stability/assembly factor-like uncharacterized protein